LSITVRTFAAFHPSRVGHPGVEAQSRIPHAQWCENMADEVKSNASPAGGQDKMSGSLEAAIKAAEAAAGPQDIGKSRPLPPVHLWNPPVCGDIGLKISRDGVWSYQNSPIGRKSLVRLFSTILRKDPDGYVLVTPVEKIAVEVEDAPFMAVEMTVMATSEGQTLRFRTNVDDEVDVGAEHPLRFDNGPASGMKPYVHVRAGLWALVTRAVAYDLVELAQKRAVDGDERLGVESGGQFFVIDNSGEESVD
jgi:uncharacterized protein